VYGATAAGYVAIVWSNQHDSNDYTCHLPQQADIMAKKNHHRKSANPVHANMDSANTETVDEEIAEAETAEAEIADAETADEATDDAEIAGAATTDDEIDDTVTADAETADDEITDAETAEAETVDDEVAEAETVDDEVADAETAEAITAEAITADDEITSVEVESSEAEEKCDRLDLIEDSTDDSELSDSLDDGSVIDAIESNGQLLLQLLEQVDSLREVVNEAKSPSDETIDIVQVEQSINEAEGEAFRDRIGDLEGQVEELQQQNSDLAAQVANANVRQTVSTTSSGSSDALSWDERKKLIFEQMENDSFDAETFLETLQNKPGDDAERPSDEAESPSEFLESLSRELQKCNAELAEREEELHEFRCLAQERSETRDDGVAIGAAAIAELVDSDELIQQERERLQMLQVEWEEKFREGEIAASLERAKLSRERQELAKKQALLEEQIEHNRRAARQEEECDSGSDSASSRKWMVKLGLHEKDK
jgi:hypothetical protein